MIAPADRGALRWLDARLRAHGYARSVDALLGGAPLHLARQVMRRLAGAARPPEIAGEEWPEVVLFFLGQSLPLDQAQRLLSPALDTLLRLELLERDGDRVRADRCGLLPIADGHFFVSRLAHPRLPSGGIAAYFGLDTLELAEYARGAPGARLLDLGCGAGIVGLLSGERDAVVGADLSPEAVRLASINAALNGAAYDARCGDLYQPVAGERFDLIVADPPSLAIPDELAFPVYGSGGPDGDRLLRRILEGAEPHLLPGGRLFAITELQAAGGEVAFFEWCQKFVAAAPGRSISIEVRASRRLPADYHRSLGHGLRWLPGWDQRCADPGERLERFAIGRGLAFGYWIHLCFEPRTATPSSLSIDRCFPVATLASRPRRVFESGALRRRLADYYAHAPEEFGELFLGLLDRARGEETLGAIAHGFGDDPSRTLHLVELATALAQLGIVTLDPSTPTVAS